MASPAPRAAATDRIYSCCSERVPGSKRSAPSGAVARLSDTLMRDLAPVTHKAATAARPLPRIQSPADRSLTKGGGMKRFATVVALVVGVALASVGTASADSNTGVQIAVIKQVAVASAPAVQYAGGAVSTKTNSSSAGGAKFPSIQQWMLQLNH